MPGDVIVFRGVSFSYDGRPLIEGLDLGLRSGCVTGVVGPNGCGKSTLLKLAGGLLPPRAGAVEVAGVRLDALSAKQRAKAVALLPQDTPAVSMTVRDLVSSGRYAHRGLLQSSSEEDGDAVAEAISLVGAQTFAHRPVRSLSGGQRQRAYLAMLLAQHAPVMLLDEPTSALDIRAAFDTLALVCSARETRDASVVVVMHDLDLALRYCDRIAVMERGRVFAHGPSGEFDVRFFSPQGGVVKSGQGVPVQTEPLADADAPEVLIVPGGMGVYAMLEDDAFIARLAELSAQARYVLSVCNGAFLYAKAGVFDGRRATTYKARMGKAEELFPDVIWERSARWTVDGNLYVSSGVSAGTDMALGFIADVCGRDIAERTAAYAEYTWNADPANDPFAQA